MKINFEKFPCFINITKQEKLMIDVKTNLSNTLYTQGGGIKMGALALKIYNSDENTDFNENECNLLLKFVKGVDTFSPIFIDSLEDLIKNEDKNNE